jgi:hypothetical protein
MIDKNAYIKGEGLACPFCGSESVQGGFVQIEAGKGFQEMSCAECEGAWQDVYQLVDVIPDEGRNRQMIGKIKSGCLKKEKIIHSSPKERELIAKVRAGHFQYFQDLFSEVSSPYSDFFGIDPYPIWEVVHGHTTT